MVANDFNFYINDQIEGINKKFLYKRFSPGYRGWHVHEQRKLFLLLKPEDKIGVTLTEGDLMIPEKSTSGIMGLKKSSNSK